MNRFANALRNAVYALDVPLAALTAHTDCGRTTIYDVIHGRTCPRQGTALTLAKAAIIEIDSQISRREKEVGKLRQLKTELRDAYNQTFGGGAHGGDNGRTEKP